MNFKGLNQHKRKAYLLNICLVIVFGVSACQMRQKGRKPSQDWSRSVPIGVFVRGNIDMVVRPDGSQVDLVWLKEGEDDRNVVHYVQLNQEGTTKVARDLSLPADQLRNPHLQFSNGSHLHLLWSSRMEGQRRWSLWYGQLNQEGELVGQPIRVAPSEQDVNQFTSRADGEGGITIVWEAERDDGIYGARINSDGELVQERTKLVERGRAPSIAGNNGRLYMTWLSGNDVHYSQVNRENLSEVEGQKITSLGVGDGKALDGPILSFSDDWAYVIWSIFTIRGLEAGTGVMEYLAFPKDAPVIENGQWLKISPAEEHEYIQYESAYQISQLVRPTDVAGSTDLVREPEAAQGRGSELAVAAAVNQDFRLNRYTQVGVMIFEEGQFKGYQMAGKTEAFSQEPVLAADDQGNLYIAWREGGQGSLAYFAVTAPEARAALDRIEFNDFANIALNGGIELVTGILFFPLACVWLFPGLLIIGFFHYLRGESDIDQPATIILLVLSIIVSLAMKFLFLPTITSYVPFSAWVDVAARWESALQIIVPIFTTSIGFLVAWRMHERTPSALAFFFWFIATDAFLTLAIYGVTFLGVF